MSRTIAIYEFYKVYEWPKFFDDIQDEGQSPKYLPTQKDQNKKVLVATDSDCIRVKEMISQGYQLEEDWKIYKTYIDTREGRRSIRDRKALREMLFDAKEGKFDLVVVRSMSRFCGRMIDAINTVNMLKKINVEVYFKEENIWTMHEGSDILLHSLWAIARKEEMDRYRRWRQWSFTKKENGELAHAQQLSFPTEHLTRTQKLRKKLQAKMENGVLVGSHRVFGYDYDSDSKSLTINEPEAMVVRYIFDRYVSGVKGGAIARELNDQGRFTRKGNHWTSRTVLLVIENEKYKGDISLGKGACDVISNQELLNYCYIKGHHVPIVSSEVFDKAQRIRNERRGKKAKRV